MKERRGPLLSYAALFDCRIPNCERALKVAEAHLMVPAILSAADMSSEFLDESSCVTYLAYFVRKNGPGYCATLRDVQKVRGHSLQPVFKIMLSQCISITATK